MTVSKSTRPNWNEPEELDDNQAREIEAQVEMRMKAKRLCDCELPEGFRLVTPHPKQYWLEHQLRWGFELGYGTYRHVARYLQQVTDETQMRWAIDDFMAELMFAGVRMGVEKRQTPRERAVLVLN